MDGVSPRSSTARRLSLRCVSLSLGCSQSESLRTVFTSNAADWRDAERKGQVNFQLDRTLAVNGLYASAASRR